MEAKRRASASTPPRPPWAVRRSSEAAVRRAAARTALFDPDLKLVSRDVGRTSSREPDRLLRQSQTRECRHDEGQQAVLHLEYARGSVSGVSAARTGTGHWAMIGP